MKNRAEKDKRKNKLKFSTFLADSRGKEYQTIKFIRNLIWQHHEQQQDQKNINQQQQNIKQFTSGVSKYTQEKIFAEVSF